MKKITKRFIASILSIVLISNLGVSALAASDTKNISSNLDYQIVDQNTVIVNDYIYQLEQIDSQNYTISTIKDNQLVQTINASIGKDEIYVTNYRNSEGIISSKPITTETPKLSEVIQFNTNGSFQEDISANAIENNSVGIMGTETYIGYVTYRVYNPYTGTSYETLNFYKDFYNSYHGDFTLNAGVGTSLSYILSALIGGFTTMLTMNFAIGFITTLGVSVAGDKISSAISASVNGTVYKYGLIAKDVPSSRTRSYEGARIVATTWDNLNHKPITKTYYDGYYPEFITKQDISVAYAIYSDFWLDSMDVYSWNPY